MPPRRTSFALKSSLKMEERQIVAGQSRPLYVEGICFVQTSGALATQILLSSKSSK